MAPRDTEAAGFPGRTVGLDESRRAVAPGFEDFMRAESVPEGQKITPLTKAEDAQMMKEHANAVIYAEP
jgi:hypothetical protein